MTRPGTPERAAQWRGALPVLWLFPLIWALVWGVMAVAP